jgi:hypothetical protein
MSLLAGACAGSSPEPGAAAPAGGAVAVIALPRAEATAGAPVDLTVTASAAQLRIELAGVSQPADELTAELEAAATGEVRRWPVDAAAGGVSVIVPIYAVPAGEHTLTLWQGDANVVARYRFRVRTG